MSRLNNAQEHLMYEHGYLPCLARYTGRTVEVADCVGLGCNYCPAHASVLIPSQMEVLDVTATKSDQ